MTDQLDDYLAPYRREVLAIVRYASAFCHATFILISVVLPGIESRPVSLYLTFTIGTVFVGIVFFIRERNIQLQATVCTVVFYLVGTLVLYSSGPIYSAGIIYVCFVAWFVFFHNQLIVPLTMILAGLLCIAILEQMGLTPAWARGPMTVQQWLSTIIVPFFPVVGGCYLLHQLLQGLIRSLIRESEARRRELNIQREKDLIDKAMMQRYRLESLGRLSSGVAHDFNNILTVLMGCLEVLRVVNDKPTRDEILNDMETAVRSAEATSRQLLTLSTSGQKSKEPADPRTSLRTLIGNLKRLFPETIVIEDYVRGTPKVALGTGDFEQVILNLCTNARDSMPDGGTITINCYQPPGEDNVIVEISDNGTGMSEEILAKAIDPFFTTKIETEGTGLGLSQVYGALQNVGGDIVIDSTVGQGTRVKLVLPIAEPRQIEEQGSEAQGRLEGANQSVLFVDDDELVCATMSRALASAGYQVTSVSSVTDALNEISNTNFDILITDRGLPDGDPDKVMSRFKKMNDGPVLLISGYETDDDLGERVGFLLKPFSPSTLLNRLDALRDETA